jgi:hypothetical protein
MHKVLNNQRIKLIQGNNNLKEKSYSADLIDRPLNLIQLIDRFLNGGPVPLFFRKIKNRV